jgi:hypothetical protein
MYAVNEYASGEHFVAHQDHFDGTVLIVTTTGTRTVDLYKREPEDDVFKDIEASVTLTAGSVLLLNGFANIGHAATCIDGPSVSVVADAPMLPQ